jgi:hypothetical protein
MAAARLNIASNNSAALLAAGGFRGVGAGMAQNLRLK